MGFHYHALFFDATRANVISDSQWTAFQSCNTTDTCIVFGGW